MALANSESITSDLAMMPDQALKQMAMMHQSDPYMLPLIIGEDTRRKKIRAATQAQAPGGPQPKVVEEAIAGIGQLAQPQPPQAPQPPPQQPGGAVQPQQRPPGMPMQGQRPPGIGGLPPQRLAKGGVVGFAGGGPMPPPAGVNGQSAEPMAPPDGVHGQIAGPAPMSLATSPQPAFPGPQQVKTSMQPPVGDNRYMGGFGQPDGNGAFREPIGGFGQPDGNGAFREPMGGFGQPDGNGAFREPMQPPVGDNRYMGGAQPVNPFQAQVHPSALVTSQPTAPQSTVHPSALQRPPGIGGLAVPPPDGVHGQPAAPMQPRVAPPAMGVHGQPAKIPPGISGLAVQPRPQEILQKQPAMLSQSSATGVGGLQAQKQPTVGSLRLAKGGVVGYAGAGAVPSYAAEKDLKRIAAGDMGSTMEQLLESLRQAQQALQETTDPAARADLEQQIAMLRLQLSPAGPKMRAASSARQLAAERSRPGLNAVQQAALAEAGRHDEVPSGIASLVDQIPGSPTAAQKEKMAWESQFRGQDPDKGFARWLGEDVLGMSRDTTRQIGHGLQALTPVSTPLAGAASGLGALSRVARGAAVTPALVNDATPPALGGKIAQALPEPTPTAPAGIAALAGNSVAGFAELEAAGLGQQEVPNFTGPEAKEAVAEAAKATVPKEKRKGMTSEDYLTLGLQLLANKSPRFLTALGEAGLATLQARKGREKDALDARKGEADIRKDDAQAEHYRAQAAQYASGDKKMRDAIEAGQKQFDNWLEIVKTNPMLKLNTSLPAMEAKRRELIVEQMKTFGVEQSKIDAFMGQKAGTASYASRPGWGTATQVR